MELIIPAIRECQIPEAADASQMIRYHQLPARAVREKGDQIAAETERRDKRGQIGWREASPPAALVPREAQATEQRGRRDRNGNARSPKTESISKGKEDSSALRGSLDTERRTEDLCVLRDSLQHAEKWKEENQVSERTVLLPAVRSAEQQRLLPEIQRLFQDTQKAGEKTNRIFWILISKQFYKKHRKSSFWDKQAAAGAEKSAGLRPASLFREEADGKGLTE